MKCTTEQSQKNEERFFQLLQNQQDRADRSEEAQREHEKAQEERRSHAAGKDVPPLAKVDNTELLEPFLENFEAQMRLYKVLPQYWMTYLLPTLDADSTTTQKQMLPEDQLDYEKVKDVLLHFHGLNPSHYRNKWERSSSTPRKPESTWSRKWQSCTVIGARRPRRWQN